MPKLKIRYLPGPMDYQGPEGKAEEELEADGYKDEGEWITFTQQQGAGTSSDPYRTNQVLRVRASTVDRIEIVG